MTIRTWHASDSGPKKPQTPPAGPKGPGESMSKNPGDRAPSAPPHWLSRHLGKPVHCRLVDGTEVSGDLLQIYQYELLLRCNDEDVLLLKHAISHVRAGGPR